MSGYRFNKETAELKVLRNTRGFTLTELLVVLFIIALQVSIILPALANARRQSKDVVCKANLKVQGQVIALYLHDNNDIFPTDTYNTIFSAADFANFSSNGIGGPAITAISRYEAATGETFAPTGLLMPYMEGLETCVCPTLASEFRKQSQDKISYSYSYNWWLGRNTISKKSQVRSPATTFWAGEEALWLIYDENGNRINSHTLNDTALVARWPMNLNTLRTLTRDDFPPYMDCFGDFHNAANAYQASRQYKPSGGNTHAACLDGHVAEVEPLDTYEYANGL